MPASSLRTAPGLRLILSGGIALLALIAGTTPVEARFETYQHPWNLRTLAITAPDGEHIDLSLSFARDGDTMLFLSDNASLDPGDTNESRDLFAYDRRTGE